MGTVDALPRSFPSRYGAPVIEYADLTIFTKQYFTHCLECTFCADACCSTGVDVDLHHVDQMNKRATAVEAYTGISRERWFSDNVVHDPELPGGGSLRTRVVDGACVFLNRSGRGCLIHSFAVEMGIDYHDLKSIVDCLFPLSVTDRTLCPVDEVDDMSLVCVGTGPTLYRGLRQELEYYFGGELTALLDSMEGQIRESPG